MPLCFDLDGTLGLFGGGYLLLREALADIWGEQPSAAELALCHGSTDWEIVDQLHAVRFGGSIPDPDYAAYDRACLSRVTPAAVVAAARSAAERPRGPLPCAKADLP